MRIRAAGFSRNSPLDTANTSLGLLGTVLLGICTAGSMLLVLHHFRAVSLPGCGITSGCNWALSGEWSRIFGWPLSFLSLAYFVGLLAAWTALTERGVSSLFRVTVLIGGVISAAYLLLMVVAQYFCWYCLVIHVCNMSFSIFVFRIPAARASSPASMVTWGAVFALVSATLNVAVSEQTRYQREQAQRSAYASSGNALSPRRATSRPTSSTVSAVPPQQPAAAARIAAAELSRDVEDSGGQLSALPPHDSLAARQPHRFGPDGAKAQLVVFYDYQSVHCQRIDQEIQDLLVKYSGQLSVTVKQFPMCAECNFSLEATVHPNACRAALAAETAGQLKGDTGFQEMHRWLLDHAGDFSDNDLRQGLAEMNYSKAAEFFETMHSTSALAAIMADIVDARAMHIRGAPAVLLNGRLLPQIQTGRLTEAVVATVEDRPLFAAGQESLTPPATPFDDTITALFPLQIQTSVWASTVRIVNSSGSSVGSGVIFAVREPFVYVLSAYHIVLQTSRVEVQTFASQSYPQPESTYPWATIIATSENADLAVIRFSTRDPLPVPLRIADLDALPPTGGFPVLTVGCEGRDMPPTCLANEVLETKLVRRTADSAPLKVWEVARESAAGRSGGPLVDQRGLLLGIASGVSDGKGYYCHTDEIYRFLDANGLQGLYSVNP